MNTASRSVSGGNAPRSRSARELRHRVAARRADEQHQEREPLRLVEPAGDAEVHEHGAAVGLHHEVAAVQVAVEDAVEHRALHERRRARRAAPLRCRRRRPSSRRRRPTGCRRAVPSRARAASRASGAGAGTIVARWLGLREHARDVEHVLAPRGGSRAPRRSSPRTARPARAGWRARRPGCGRRGAARATTSPRMSSRTSRATCGRCTLTTTSSPVRSRAACTCAIDAAAIGVRSKRSNTSSSERPSSSSTTRRTSSNGSGGTRSRSSLNSATSSSGNRPSPPEMIWPSLM